MTYSIDLINAALNYHKISKLSSRKVAEIFGISKSILCYWLKELPLIYSSVATNKSQNITVEMLNFVKNSLNHNPYQIQKVIQEKLNKKFNIDISIFTVRTILKIIKYTKKKVSRKLYNKDLKMHKYNRKEFKKKIKKIKKEDIICIDEVGVTRDTYCKNGYCHKSKRLQYFVDMAKLPKKRSIIVAISNEKIVHYKVLTNKNANKKFFLEFIEELTQKVKNKKILMDNVNFHKGKEIIEAITKSNNEPLFIPPYSPEFNPIEELFSSFKSYLRNKINVITGFLKLDYHIDYFFKSSHNIECYYSHAFG